MSAQLEDSVEPNRQLAIGNWQSPSRDWPAWAVYLGVTWTWCIGMFLPVLLIRDYGNAGFWIFAIPNVIGAAAMGWVLRSPAESRAFVAAHAPAVRAFTAVTLLFHAFFIGWFCFVKGGALWPALACVLMLLWMLPLARGRPLGGAVAVAIVALLASLGFGAALLQTIWRIDLASIITRAPAAPPMDLAGLAAVCCIGFFLCPYLDATFHQARQRLPAHGSSRLAFGVGFGVVFAAMIGMTFAYADVINLSATTRGVIGTYIAIHVAIQAAATITLHASALRPRWPKVWLGLLGVAGLGLAAGGWAADRQQGEFIYRLFMAFYGLVAPAYVWIVGIRSTQPPTRRQWIVLLIVVVLATPFYWMAFIEKQMPWALAGVAIVLAGRLVAGRK